jgi:SAM-dependent methyltransferase
VPGYFPLRVGARDDFARVADYLRAAGYDADALCSRLGVPDLFAADDLPRADLALSPAAEDPLAFLARTFFFLQPVSEVALRARLDGPTRAAFERLGLLAAEPGGEAWTAPVLLYPVGDCHIASDRHRDADGSPATRGADAVFPAIFPGSLLFLRLLPRGAREDALDLGAGTGIAALALSRSVRRVVAADLTERATHFARFNQRLNARDNVEAVTGDLYAAVAGRTFDCIVSHPPYVPSLDDALVFRDGGPTGERIVRRMIVELPDVLRPGGVFCAVCGAWDTADAPLEQRIRGWLGARADEFDVLLGVERVRDPGELAEQLLEPGRRGDRAAAVAWEGRFREAGLVSHVFGAVALARRVGAGAPETLRTWLGSTARGADVERTLAVLAERATQTAAGTRAAALDAIRPRLAEGLTALVEHAVQAAALAPRDLVLATTEPFKSRTRVDPWILPVLSAFDGAHTPREVLAALRARRGVPEGFSRMDLHRLLEMLLERGYVEDTRSTPAAPPGRA